MTTVNLQMASNHENMAAALMAAESGLEYANALVAGYLADGSTKTFNSTVSDDEAIEEFNNLVDYVRDRAAVIVGDAVAFSEGGATGLMLAVPAISLQDGGGARFALTFKQYDSAPQTFEVTSAGESGTIQRNVRLSYNVAKDTSILKYAVASRSRLIITGDSTIEGDVYSSWGDPYIAPPIELEDVSTVNGTISTTVAEEDWDGSEVEGTYDDLLYGEPDIPGFTVDDFDTSMYIAMTSTLPASGNTEREYFPHAAGDYTQPVAGSKRLQRQVYENETFTDRRLPAGRNALFRNCTFEGLLYIGIAANSATNNVRFENCQFNGAIVTGVPQDFEWKNSVLYFTGSSTFNNTAVAETTILAPNFNVNIGNTKELESESESVITGLIVGGIVDVRGNANVNGTILSMYDPSELGYAARAYGTNVGFSDENNEAGIPEDIGTIHIAPDPDNLLPLGVSSQIVFNRDSNTYVEL